MTWTKVSDDFFSSLAHRDLDIDVLGFIIACTVWCNNNLTDGKIPKRLISDVWRPTKGRNPYRKLVFRCIAADLLSESEDHYFVQHFFPDQPTRESVLNERMAAKKRIAEFRKRTKTGHGNGVTPTVTNGVTNAHSRSRIEANSHPGGSKYLSNPHASDSENTDANENDALRTLVACGSDPGFIQRLIETSDRDPKTVAFLSSLTEKAL